MKQVYQAASVIDAQLVCDLLKDAGFNALVHGGYLSGAIGELPADTLISVYLLAPSRMPQGWKHLPGEQSNHAGGGTVSDADFAIARDLIAEFEASSRANAKYMGCDAAPINCSDCGEENDAGFGICWNCQTPLHE